MSAVGHPIFPNYGSINADSLAAVTACDPLAPLEIAATEAKICGVARKVFFNIAAAASLSVAVFSGGAIILAYKQPGVGIVLMMSSAMVPYLYRHVVQHCPILCCKHSGMEA